MAIVEDRPAAIGASRRGIRGPLRAVDADLVDVFFVTAVASLLLIRAFLEATGYPQLGGGGLHVAHVLWGGLGMLVAILLLLLFASPGARWTAALVGGAGFGAFIDELGKFLTSDNNYFFKPTAALVYVLFVLLFLALRDIRHLRALSPEEQLVDALALSQRLATRSLTLSERDRALALLANADQTVPLVAGLQTWFRTADLREHDASGPQRLRSAMRRRAETIVANRWFRRAISAFFVIDAIVLVLTVLEVTALLGGIAVADDDARAALAELMGDSPVSFWVSMLATLIAAGLMVRGVFALRHSRVAAYRAFEQAVLVDLLLAKPPDFFVFGFGSVVAVFIDVLLLAALRYLETIEHQPIVAAPRAPSAEDTVRDPSAARGERRTVDLTGLAQPFRILVRLGYLCLAALLLVTLVSRPLVNVWGSVEFESTDGILRMPATLTVVAGIALVVGWAFLLTGAAYFRRRMFALVAIVFLLVVVMQGGFVRTLLLLAIGGFALWAHFARGHLARWQALPFVEFAAWCVAGAVLIAPVWTAAADPASAEGLAVSFELIVLLAMPFWLLLAVEVSEMAVDAGRWLVAAAQRRVGGGLVLTVAVLLVPPVFSLGLTAENERWGAMLLDVVAALVLLGIGIVVLIRRRWTNDVARVLQVLSIAALILAWALSIGLGGSRSEPQDPLEWMLAWTSLPPIFLFILALTFNVLSYGARYCNADSALMPREGRVLAYFGFAILLAGGLLLLANSQDAAGNPPELVKSLTTSLAALGVLFVSFPYLGWLLIRRRERLLRP